MPTEYLPLAPLGATANSSEYAAGGSSPGSSVRTRYSRLRINPSTLALSTSDQRFSTSTGQLTSQGTTAVTSMPFGAATSCSPETVGSGSIDLRGTPFALADNQLAVRGGDPQGILADALNQTFQLKGKSGLCGMPVSLGGVANAYNQNGGALKLQLTAPSSPSATCAQVRQKNPAAADGLYTLYVGGDSGKPWVAWCQDMTGTPKEYLSLAVTGPESNYSQYTAGGWSPGTSVRTVFTRLRMNPITFAIDTSDPRFSLSTGRLNHAGTGNIVTSMPFAAAMDCMTDSISYGRGAIDLRGTPFAVVPNQFFPHGGAPFVGNTLYGAHNQTVQLTGGGRCGWNALGDAYDPFNQNGGSLRLQYMAPHLPSATCAQVRQKNPAAGDDFYTLHAEGNRDKPWVAWCQDMAGTPKEYLALASTGPGYNASVYAAGGLSPGQTVYTEYRQVRIDPATFTVDTSDQRFARSWGRLDHAGDRNHPVTSMPYASAMDCMGNGGASGRATLDLRGTPFVILPNQFVIAGGSPVTGSTTYGDVNQTATLWGGGRCGWNTLAGATDPSNQNGGSLRLQYGLVPTLPLLPATCAQVRQLSPGAPDGVYPLFVEGDLSRPWMAWCQDMAGTPLEYLSLPTPSANVSEFLAGTQASGSAVRTVYSKLRVDPVTLSLQTGDQRFAASTGQLTTAGEQVTSMPLGAAIGCDATGRGAQSTIDLRGTPFALVANQFSATDGRAEGVASGDGGQTLQLRSNASVCGWVAPPGSAQPLNQGSGATLALRHIAAFLPATCAQVRQDFPLAADGHYTLYVGGDAAKPWKAWCQDMAGTPLEYLPLAPLGASANFSEYLAGGLAQGSTVRTVYTRLRIDPGSLGVNTADQRFATSTGQLTSGGTQVTAMPYATAMNCNLSGATGQGSIDLRGTPFSVNTSALTQGGSLARGSAAASALGQTVQLQGGGSCGWFSLRGASSPINQNGGALALTYGPSST